MKNNNETAEPIANAAGNVKASLSIIGNAAKGAGEAINPVIGKIGKVAGIVEKAIKDPDGGLVEKAVCGAANVLTQGAMGAKIIGEGALRGAAAMPKNPYLMAAGGVIGGAAVAPIVGAAVKPYGEAAQKICHAAFDYAKGLKQEQKSAAQNIVTEQHARDKAINGFKPNIPTIIPLAKIILKIHYIGLIRIRIISSQDQCSFLITMRMRHVCS